MKKTKFEKKKSDYQGNWLHNERSVTGLYCKTDQRDGYVKDQNSMRCKLYY